LFSILPSFHLAIPSRVVQTAIEKLIISLSLMPQDTTSKFWPENCWMRDTNWRRWLGFINTFALRSWDSSCFHSNTDSFSKVAARKDVSAASLRASPASLFATPTRSLEMMRSSVPISSVALATKNSPDTPTTTSAHANTSNSSFLTLGRSGDLMVALRNAWRFSQKSKKITPSSKATPTTTIPVQMCSQELSIDSQRSSSEDLAASAFNRADVSILESRRDATRTAFYQMVALAILFGVFFIAVLVTDLLDRRKMAKKL